MESQMRVIVYYDRIFKQYIELEVTDKVARFLMANDKWLRRKQNQYNYFNTQLSDYEQDEKLTLKQKLYENANNEQTEKYIDKQRQELFDLVWKIVGKLKETQQQLIKDIYVTQKSQKQIAEEMNKTPSAITQLKQTSLTHLAYYFYSDKEFMKTDLYKRNEKEFKYDLTRVAKEMDKTTGLSINLNDVYKLVKDNTQILKTMTSLGLDISENFKKFYSNANREVLHFFEKLNLDFSKENYLNIPVDFKLPQDLDISKIFMI